MRYSQVIAICRAGHPVRIVFRDRKEIARAAIRGVDFGHVYIADGNATAAVPLREIAANAATAK